MQEDIKTMKKMEMDAFALSISWTRILPSNLLALILNMKNLYIQPIYFNNCNKIEIKSKLIELLFNYSLIRIYVYQIWYNLKIIWSLI